MPSMTSWRDRTFWSIAHDCEMCRVSGFDDHGDEHFLAIDVGPAFKERREAAVIFMQEQIEAGHKPGELDIAPIKEELVAIVRKRKQDRAIEYSKART